MRLTSLLPLSLLCFCTAASATTHHPAKKSSTAKPTSSHTKSSGRHATASSRASAHGKKGKHSTAKPVSHASPMDSERATAIQTALIKRGYLTGEPSGKWDAASISAMQKLQSDNGWQSRVVPDARGLIKLGLGPQPETPAASQPKP